MVSRLETQISISDAELDIVKQLSDYPDFDMKYAIGLAKQLNKKEIYQFLSRKYKIKKYLQNIDK
jgi:hypothetical protein